MIGKGNYIYILFFIAIFVLPVKNLLALPNIGVDAATLPKGILFSRERLFYADYTQRYDYGGKRYLRLADNEYYRSFWGLTEIAYGVTNNLTLVANLWYYDAEIKSGKDIGRDRGIGDFYIFSKYKFFSIEDEPGSGLAGLFAIRFPTGDKENMPILRFGDGSTDIGVGFAFTKQWEDLTNSIFGGIWINNKSSRALDKRHEIEYRATTEYKLPNNKLNLQLELKGLFFEGNNEYLLELVPGIQYTPLFPLIHGYL